MRGGQRSPVVVVAVCVRVYICDHSQAFLVRGAVDLLILKVSFITARYLIGNTTDGKIEAADIDDTDLNQQLDRR